MVVMPATEELNVSLSVTSQDSNIFPFFQRHCGRRTCINLHNVCRTRDPYITWGRKILISPSTASSGYIFPVGVKRRSTKLR